MKRREIQLSLLALALTVVTLSAQAELTVVPTTGSWQ